MTRRILTAVLLMTVLAVVAFFVPAAFAIRSAQQRGELLELQREASIVATQLASIGPGDITTLQQILDSDRRLGVYAADGQRLGGTGPSSPDRIVRLGMAGNFAEGYIGDDLVAAVPISASIAHPALVVRIEAPRSESLGRFERSLLLLAIAAIAIVAVAGAVGLWVARRLNRPIAELTRWASSRDTPDAPAPAGTGIVELDSLRSALADDRARIEELLQRERSFSSQVSHQLRTPVAAMRVAIETEIEAPRPDASTVLRESLGQIDRLESTIASLLALARHTDRVLTECGLLTLVADRLTPWNERIQAAGRRIDLTGVAVRGRVDADAIGHIVDILVDNAWVHGQGTIEVRVSHDGDDAVIDVSDDGTTPDAGDPFADQGNDSTHGIGLRLARTLAESSHGRLVLLPERNTTFRLTVPL